MDAESWKAFYFSHDQTVKIKITRLNILVTLCSLYDNNLLPEESMALYCLSFLTHKFTQRIEIFFKVFLLLRWHALENDWKNGEETEEGMRQRVA